MKYSKLKKLGLRFLALGPIEDYIDKEWLLKNFAGNKNGLSCTDITKKMVTDLSIIPCKELIKLKDEIKDIMVLPTMNWEKRYLEMLFMDRYIFWDDIFGVIKQKYLTNVTNINDLFTKKTERLSLFELENQAFQLVNYMNNMTIRGNHPLVSLMTNCNMLLKKYNNDTSTVFNDSLDNTVYVFNAQNSYEYNGYEDYIRNLKPNDNKSFIVAPITSEDHLFSIVFYKKQDANETYYEALVVNKGDRPGHTYEKYRFSEENIGTIADMLGFSKNLDFSRFAVGDISKLTTRQLYDKFKEYAINNEFEILDSIVAQDQIVGNCFYKEIEAGLKYAYSNAYDVFETKIVDGKELKTPKWPVETEKFNKELLENLKDILTKHLQEDKLTKINYVIDDIDRLITIYEINKKIRRILKNDESLTKEKLDDIFGDIDYFENEMEANVYINMNIDDKTKMMLLNSNKNFQVFIEYFEEKVARLQKSGTDLINVNKINNELDCINIRNNDLTRTI